MPAAPDPQSSQQPPQNSTPAEPDSSGAARLLEEIRERLERLEGNLSLRERRAARLERTLREADAKLQAERARYASERESIEKGLPQQLQERDKQLESAARSQQELEKRLAAQLVREREMAARIEKLTQERDQAAAYLEKAQREIRQVQSSQRELEAQLEDLNRRRGDWEHTISAATPPGKVGPTTATSEIPAWLSPVVRLSQRWRELSPSQHGALIVTALLLPIICVLAGVSTYRHYPRTYRIEAHVAAPSDRGEALARFESRPSPDTGTSSPGHLELRRQQLTPVLVASMLVRAPDRDRAIEQVNAQIAKIRDSLQQASTAATQPAHQMERDQLQGELRKVEARMAALTTRPAAGPADPAVLLAGWQKTLDERKAIDAKVAELDAKLQQKPPELSDVKLPPERLTAAIAADPRLQADSDVLGQRESELSNTLRQTMDTARPAFAELAQAAAAADKQIEETLAASHDQDVNESIQVVRTSVANCAKAAASLGKTWQSERKALDTRPAVGAGSSDAGAPTSQATPGVLSEAKAGNVDVAARCNAVETAAREFVESTGNSIALIQKSLDAIGQGGDEPTKRLVLRNALAQQIQPALDAREALAVAARQVTAGENVELTTLVQGVSGLRDQVVDRRARLEQGLREQTLAELRAAYDRDMQQLRAQRDELARKAVGMEAGIVKSAADALALLGGSQGREAGLIEWIELARTRTELHTKLAALDERDARDAVESGRLGELSYSEAVAVDLTPAGALTGWTAAGAAAPLALLALVAGLFAIIRLLRQPRGSLDEYTKALSTSTTRSPTKRQTKKRH